MWNINERASHSDLRSFLQAVVNISLTLQNVDKRQFNAQETSSVVVLPQVIFVAESMSIAIRKLMLGGRKALLRKCIHKPDFHPLALFSSFASVTITWPGERVRVDVSHQDGRNEKVELPVIDHFTIIYPVYGIHHVRGMTFGIHDPFDYNSEPIKVTKWLNTRVVEIDGQQFSAEQVLRFMANKEGAHSEDNPAMIFPKGYDGIMNQMKWDKSHSLFNEIKFGELTYLHLFTLFTGFYVVNMVKTILPQLPFSSNDSSINYIANQISQAPSSFSVKRVPITSGIGKAVFIDENLEVEGDYNSKNESYIKSPT
ncbi:MAG: hypothetical protein OXH73_04040 [Caldilineaceae bacterium]|nr:hypothetical protein [Caldilineaceae bacterium]